MVRLITLSKLREGEHVSCKCDNQIQELLSKADCLVVVKGADVLPVVARTLNLLRCRLQLAVEDILSQLLLGMKFVNLMDVKVGIKLVENIYRLKVSENFFFDICR